jgi:hypothetical protein
MSGRSSVVLFVVVACVLAAGLAFIPYATDVATGEEGATYVGSGKCKSCHKDSYEQWQEMKHSKAWASLSAEQIASGKDPKGRACVQCHTTGYGDGGFTSEKDTPKLVNVGCESCHGPASKHVKVQLEAMMNDTEVKNRHISKNVGCTKCHNPHINYKKLYGEK